MENITLKSFCPGTRKFLSSSLVISAIQPHSLAMHSPLVLEVQHVHVGVNRALQHVGVSGEVQHVGVNREVQHVGVNREVWNVGVMSEWLSTDHRLVLTVCVFVEDSTNKVHS